MDCLCIRRPTIKQPESEVLPELKASIVKSGRTEGEELVYTEDEGQTLVRPSSYVASKFFFFFFFFY
jgi:hypothetical protein